METQASTAGYAVAAEEGEARWWMGSLATIKATAADTGGLYTLVEVLEPHGMEAPLHVHQREDEGFWILEGELTFQIGDQTHKAFPGSFLFGPRGVPHTYRVDRGPARLLFILSPGGFEALIRDTSVPAAARVIPPAEEGPPEDSEMERLLEVVRSHGADILG